MPFLITPAQCDKFRKNQKNILIFDASVHGDGRDAKQEFTNKHIAGAHFFDLPAFNDPSFAPCHPNMISEDESYLGTLLGKHGIRPDCKIIFYDNSAWHTACRALWLLKLAGHNPNLLYILDGGLAAWERYKGKTESGLSAPPIRSYEARLQKKWLCHRQYVKDNLINPQSQIIDVRHPVRFAGGPETREGLRSGHIPGSFNTPLSIFFHSNGTFLSLDKIRRKIIDLGIDLKTPSITSCGSGMTAPVLNFILDLISSAPHALYNGSWTEWGKETLYPEETTLAERPISTSTAEEEEWLL